MTAFDEELFEASLRNEFNEWTKQTLSNLPTSKGVLLLTNAQSRPIQLLQAANLRRTAQAKLIRDEDTSQRRADIADMVTTLFYTCCQNPFELSLAYIRLAHAVFGTGAVDWIRLPKISLAVINTDAYLPFFYVSDNPQCHDCHRVFGLFPSRKSALQFCDILNTVFVLCRNSSLLNSGKESSCPYLQMQTCPGPCLHPELRMAYLKAIEHACEAAEGHLEPTIRQLHENMNQASQSMQFERAAAFKKKLDRLNRLRGPDFNWIRALEKLCVLHIDKGPKRKIAGKNKKRQLYHAWKITAQHVYSLGIFVPQTPDQVLSFLRHTWGRGRRLNYAADIKEHLAALSYFLFRTNPSGIWMDCTEHIREDDLINGLFGR